MGLVDKFWNKLDFFLSLPIVPVFQHSNIPLAMGHTEQP